jgi:hypothetical protein
MIQFKEQIKKNFKLRTFRTVRKHSCAEFCKNLQIRGLVMKICGFAFGGLAHLRNLLICDSRMSPRMCGFAICELLKKVCLPTSAGCTK